MKRLVARGVHCFEKITECQTLSASTKRGESFTTAPGRRVRIVTPNQVKPRRPISVRTFRETRPRPPATISARSLAAVDVGVGKAMSACSREGIGRHEEVDGADLGD